MIDIQKRKNHVWTDDDRDIVRREYTGNRRSACEIAHKLGVTANSVKGQVQKMGLAKITDRRPWTPAEEDKLWELMGAYPPLQVAKRMKRSVNSVVVRSKRLGISRRDRNGWYTKMEVCEILGVGHKWVQSRIDDGRLVAKHHMAGSTPGQDGMAMWHIKRGDLKRYLRENAHELTGRNVDLIQVVDILSGIAYES